MLRPYVLLIFLFVGSFLNAQTIDDEGYVPDDRAAVYFSLKNNAGQALSDMEIIATDKKTNEEESATTDKRGNASMRLLKGHAYTITLPGKISGGDISVPPSITGLITFPLRYDPPALTGPIKQDTTTQELPAKYIAGKKECLAILHVMNTDKKPLANMHVWMRPASGNVLAGVTDAKGDLRFAAVPGKAYTIDLGENKGFSSIMMPGTAGYTFEKELFFEPTQVTETAVGDTIHQVIPAAQQASSERAYMHIYVHDLDDHPLNNEPVYLDVDSSKRVYSGTTDSNGVVRFLVPKGVDYRLHFQYERNVDLIKLRKAQGLHNITIEYGYMGSENIENYYATAKRDKLGFLQDFMEGHVAYPSLDDLRDIHKSNAAFTFRSNETGFQIDFTSNRSAMYTPAVSGDYLFTCGDYFSNCLYCINTKTGTARWIVRLAEGGASPAVINGDYVLVTTESCSLYIIQISTGRCVWSKWLSGYLFTGPTISNGNVFAVYKNDLAGNSRYVMACFDLKTGKVKWQNWMNNEGIAAPVVVDGQVYMTTNKGELYRFDEKTGQDVKMSSQNFCSAITIQNKTGYISTGTNGNTNVAVIDCESLSVKERWTSFTGIPAEKDSYDLMKSMGMSAGRVSISGDNAYFFADTLLVCVDRTSGKEKWTAAVSAASVMTQPVLAGKFVIAPGDDKTIHMYNAATGKEEHTYKCDSPLSSSCAVDNGKIYAGTENSSIYCIDTKNKDITGWPMWNANATHNPVVATK